MNAQEHNRTLGILFLVYTGLQVLGIVIAVAVMVFVFGIMATQASGNEAAPIAFMGVVILIAILISALLIVPIAMAGFKMFKGRPNARIWGIIASIIAVINFPLGTILGIYGLWFLFGEEGKNFYLGGYSQDVMFPPPPPNVWR